MSKTFANSINSNPLYAERAEQDASGNTITTTYATKSEVSAVADVPDVTSSDNGKVLKATYENGSGSYGWESEVKKPIVAGANITITNGTNDVTIAATDTTYTFSTGLTNSSGTVTVTNPLPSSTSSDEDKVLTVDSTGAPVWAASQGGGNEVPEVTSSDDGKVLKASYSGGTGSYDWESPPTEKTLAAGSNVNISSSGSTVTISATDTTYTFSTGLTNSSGTVSVTNPIPAVTSSDDGKVLQATYSGGAGSFAWTTPSGGGNQVPAVTSNDDGKVLTATYSGSTGSYAWTTPSGGGGSSSATMHAPSKSIIFNFAATPTYNPTTSGTTWLSGSTWTQLDSANNIWLWTGPSGSWANAFYNQNGTSKLDFRFSIDSINFDSEITSLSHFLQKSGVTAIKEINGIYAEDVSSAFSSTIYLTGDIYIPEIIGCSDATYMFYGSSVNRVRIDLIQGPYIEQEPMGYTSGCNTGHMFEGCKYLKQFITGSNEYQSPSLISDATAMFKNCVELVELESLKNVVFMSSTMSSMCEGCKSLVKFPDLDFTTEDYSSGMSPPPYYTMGSADCMFKDCESLLRMPNFTGDLSGVSNTSEMFSGCKSLVSIRWSNIANFGKSEYYDEGTGETTISYNMYNVYMMFAGCWNVVHGAVEAYTNMSGYWDNLSNTGYCFYVVGADVGSTELASIPTSWGGTQS